MKLSKMSAPNTYLIIGSLLVITAALTWIIPGGEYERVDQNGREVVLGDSFTYTEKNPQGLFDILMAPIRGFTHPGAAQIIAFVFIVGGAFGVFQKTQAVNSAIMGVAKAHKNSKLIRTLLIPIFMGMFSLAGAVFGMSEEVIPFILVFVPLALILGYDSIVGVAIPFIGAATGFAGAFMNPFTLQIAQGIAGIDLLSGWEYRIIVWFIVTSIAIVFVLHYANKIKKNPEKSIMYEKDIEKRKKIDFSLIDKHQGITFRHKIVLIIFSLGLASLIYGVLQFGWYINEISAVFLLMGILVGIAGKLTINEITDSFVQGAKDLLGTALIIALARGILIIAEDGRIIDTILFALSAPVADFHPIFSSQFMFVVQSMINFFVPSGSGQAALTMPIMAPLSDLVGVSRQTAVLAFQFGDGFTNLIIPTSAVTMGVLALAEIPWEKWFKWILPLQIILFIVGLLLLIPPYLIGWK
jgi:uncharacterized ion transporter superfamily protein YfcC